jgi:hypothetical protein
MESNNQDFKNSSIKVLPRNQALDQHDPIGPPSEPVDLSAECGKGTIRLNHDGRPRADAVADGAPRRQRILAETVTIGVTQRGLEILL